MSVYCAGRHTKGPADRCFGSRQIYGEAAEYFAAVSGFLHHEVAPHREQEIHFSTLLAGQRGVGFIEKELFICLNVW